MARKPLPRAKRRTEMLRVLFTQDEMKQVRRAAEDSELSPWARRVLLEAASENGDEAEKPPTIGFL